VKKGCSQAINQSIDIELGEKQYIWEKRNAKATKNIQGVECNVTSKIGYVRK
jgi:hypothetical protein